MATTERQQTAERPRTVPRPEPPASIFAAGARQRRLVKHVVLIAAAVMMLYPLLWMVASSFKPGRDLLSDASLIVHAATLEHYTNGWDALGVPFGFFFLNSFIVVLGCIAGNLISCALAAYAFARLNFRGRRTYFAIMMVTIMLPYHAVIVPQYIMFSSLDLVNTFYPLVVPKWLATDAFFIFLMVQFMRTLPRELDQAAWVDGCGPFTTFWYIILPLMKPALATAAIFTFIWTWNDFFSPLVYLTQREIFTVPVALNALVDSEAQKGWGPLFAMSILSLVPIFCFFVGAQKYLVRGIAMTGIK